MRKVVFSVAMLCMLAFPNLASAHSMTFYHGSDYATVSTNHRTVTVCDRESDSDMFFVKLRLSNNQTGTVSDWGGSAGGCGSGTFAYPIVTIQLCEQTNSITGAHNCTGVQGVS